MSSRPTLEMISVHGLGWANPHQNSRRFPYIRPTEQTNALNEFRSFPTTIEAWITCAVVSNHETHQVANACATI